MKRIDTREAKDAKVMAELIVDPQTTDHLKVTIINKLLETNENPDFFPTIFNEKMSLGDCPDCGHTNNWLIPEDVLNKMGYVSHLEDANVSEHTNEESCPEWHEACCKKKISI